jgi:chromosome segregation ATPase
LQKVINNLTEKNFELEKLVAELNQKIQSDDSEKLREELKIAQQDIIEKNHTINNLNQEIIELKNLIAEYKNNEYRFQEFSARIDELNSANLATEEELEKAKEELKHINENYEIEITRLTEEIESYKNIEEQLRSDIFVKDSRLNELKDSLTSAEKELADLKIKFEEKVLAENALKQNMAELELKLMEKDELNSKIDELNQVLTKKDEEIEELNKKIKSLTEDRDKKNDYEEKIKQIEAEKTEVENKLIEFKQYQADFHRMQNEIVQLQSKISEKESKLKLLNNDKLNLENKLFSALKEKTSLIAQKDSLNEKIGELQDLLISKDEIISLQQENLKNYETINIEKEVQKQTLINSIETYLEKIEKKISDKV